MMSWRRMAKAQGVKPVFDPEDLMGGWPEREDFDSFYQTISESPEYGAGLAAGKAKAHFEVREWRPGNHAAECECEPCVTARTVLRHPGEQR